MKSKIIILLLEVSFVASALAQTDSLKTNKKNHNYKWGVGLALNSVEAQIGDPEKTSWGFEPLHTSDKKEKSISFSVIPKYRIKDKVLLRFEFGITKIDFSYNEEYRDGTHTLLNQTIHQNIYRYVPAIQFLFFRERLIDIYCGITLPFINYNSIDYNFYSQTRNLATDTLTYLSTVQYSNKGGDAFGIGGNIGLNFYFLKCISAGIEFSDALLYYDLGGQYSYVATFQSVPNQPVHKPTATYSSSYQGVQFSKILCSFNLSIWF